MPTFLFTDIEGSTDLWSRYPHAMEGVLKRHDRLLEELIIRHGGQVVKHTGDGFFAVFDGGEPLTCALAVQKRLADEAWGEVGELRVRMALHTGVAQQREADYFGLEVSRTARLLSAGWGGQILLTCELARAAVLPPGARIRDLGNHLLKDLSEPQHIYQLLHPELLLREFPPLRTLSAHPHNLPPQPTPFVGRTQELQEIAARLADPSCRLLTLTGSGGIGKTRLALQAAAAEVESFAHGVYFVPLAALSSSESLVPAIAEALRFSFYQRDVPRIQLLNYLREKHLLLVLDNFEHVMDGVLLVSELLSYAPHVKVLATSRERLNVRGELALTVAGMTFPAEESAPDLELYSAVQLFLQHARRVKPTFVFDEEQRASVVRICARVRGMPLALELAASWLRLLTCREIAAELEHSLDLLSSTLRDLPERHRSLRAVFDYSWQLLSEPEKRVVQTLAVFQDAFHHEAAFAVLRAPGEPGSPVVLLGLLAVLADKSLLQRRAGGTYSMQTLLHDYALEKLQAAPALEAQVRRRHSAYYAGFLQERRAELGGAEQQVALAAIADVLEDVRAAWSWAVQQGEVTLVEQGLHGLALFFTLSGRNREGIPLFESALATLEPLDAPETAALRGWLLAYVASLATHANGDERAKSLAEAALVFNRRLDMVPASAVALTSLGRAAWFQGDYPAADEHYREALNLYLALGDVTGQAQVFDSLGSVAWALGKYTDAQTYFQRSRALFEQSGIPSGLASVLDHLGVVARDTGDWETARECFEQSYEILDTLGARISLAYTANHLGGALAETNGLAKAEPYFKRSIAIGEELGERRIVAYTLYDWASLLTKEGDGVQAASLLGESQTLFEAVGDQFGLIVALIGLGDLALEEDGPQKAQPYYLDAVRATAAIQNLRLASSALTGWARYLLATERFLLAAETLGFVQTLPDDQAETGEIVAELLARAAERLPGDVFTAALAWGRDADLEGVLARALPAFS
ncbi:MAG: ATP-binding protein [Anaerolineales bacterium]